MVTGSTELTGQTAQGILADPLSLSVSSAAKRVGISRSLIYQEIKAGRLASAKLGKRRLIPLDALREWLARATARAL